MNSDSSWMESRKTKNGATEMLFTYLSVSHFCHIPILEFAWLESQHPIPDGFEICSSQRESTKIGLFSIVDISDSCVSLEDVFWTEWWAPLWWLISVAANAKTLPHTGRRNVEARMAIRNRFIKDNKKMVNFFGLHSRLASLLRRIPRWPWDHLIVSWKLRKSGYGFRAELY